MRLFKGTLKRALRRFISKLEFISQTMKLPKFLQPPTNEWEIFKFGKGELKFLGCYIEDYTTWWRYLLGFISASLVGILALSQYAIGIQYLNQGNLPSLFEVLCPGTTMLVTSFKLYVLLYKQKELHDLFKLFETTFAAGLPF